MSEWDVAILQGEIYTFQPVTGGEVAVVASALNQNAKILEKLIKRVEELEKKEGDEK